MGRNSLINNIRLFVGDKSHLSRYVENMEEAVAYSRRIAWFLNSESFSLGAFPELYVLFTSSLDPGSVRVTADSGEWWHRYVHVGVAEDFAITPDAVDIAKNGIVQALLAVRPDRAAAIRQADLTVRAYGSRLRFLLQRREMARTFLELSFNIAAYPKPSHLFIAQINKADGRYLEAEPITLGDYLEGFDLVNGIRLADAKNLEEQHLRSFVTKLVRRRG